MDLWLNAQRSERKERAEWVPRWIKCLLCCKCVTVLVQVWVCTFLYVCHSEDERAHSTAAELSLTPLASRDSCALPLASGDQLKPSGGVRGAELLWEPAELENRGFRPAQLSASSSSSSTSFKLCSTCRQAAREMQCGLIMRWYSWCLLIYCFLGISCETLICIN